MKQFEFMVSLDGPLGQEAIKQQVIGALEARHPGHRFSPYDGLPLSIIPMIGRPHPTRRDEVICDFPPTDLVREVRESFNEIAASFHGWKPS